MLSSKCKKIELHENEDNFITVRELIRALQSIPNQDSNVIIYDDVFSGRAMNESDLYVSDLGNVYIGGDPDEE